MPATPTQPAYLTISRHGTYYFRVVIPKPLRSAFGVQREMRRSLKTDSLRLALRRARQYAARFEAAFETHASYKSAITEEEWHELEAQLKRSDIVKALTGHTKRPIPERQRELAESLYTASLSLPRPQFVKLLPKLIDSLALQQLRAPAQAVAPSAPPILQAEQRSDGPTLYELWELQRQQTVRLAHTQRN